MAAAGAERVFNLMDERAETDNGYVELVNVKENADGTLVETTEKTNMWAWKHPHKAEGTTTYVKLEGDVTFDGVGRLDATDGECIAAAKLANAHGFIRRLSDGYQTWLSG